MDTNSTQHSVDKLLENNEIDFDSDSNKKHIWEDIELK